MEGESQPDRQMRADRAEMAAFAPDHLARYRWAARRAEGPILDAGCGSGYGTSILNAMFDMSYGLDVEQEALLFGAKHFPGPKYGRADIQSRKVFKDAGEEFNSITCFEVLEHLPHPDRALANFYKILKPEGRLYCSVPNEDYYPFRAETFKGEKYPHLRHYKPGEFIDLLAGAGFMKIGINCQKAKQEPEVIPGDNGRYLVCVAIK